jgi:hypothetical protein
VDLRSNSNFFKKCIKLSNRGNNNNQSTTTTANVCACPSINHCYFANNLNIADAAANSVSCLNIAVPNNNESPPLLNGYPIVGFESKTANCLAVYSRGTLGADSCIDGYCIDSSNSSCVPITAARQANTYFCKPINDPADVDSCAPGFCIDQR